MESAEIELRGISQRFAPDEPYLFQNLSLRIEKGERLVLIGPSGVGKSVLLKIMSGILKPTEGQVLIQGQDLYSLREKEQSRLLLKMGMLFQKNALFDSMTAAENIGFSLREVAGKSEQEIEKKVRYFLQEVAIPESYGLFPDEISGGMQKRLGIARALALNPEIIFYDDPTAGLDPITSRLIVDLICRLQEENNTTLVAITNDMSRAYQMADKIGMLVDGELIITGNQRETMSHENLKVQQFITGNLVGPLSEET